MTPSKAVFTAAMRMHGEDLIPLMNYLRESRRETLEKLSTAPTEQLQVLQGEARSLAKILDLIDNASALVEKQ